MATVSPSSASEGDGRGQTSPTTALVAVVMVCLGVSLYATVLSGVSAVPDRNLATPTLERAHDALAPAGVVDPEHLRSVTDAGPNGHRLNVSVVAAGSQWHVGPVAPATADRANRRVAVRTPDDGVRPGVLYVRVWR